MLALSRTGNWMKGYGLFAVLCFISLMIPVKSYGAPADFNRRARYAARIIAAHPDAFGCDWCRVEGITYVGKNIYGEYKCKIELSRGGRQSNLFPAYVWIGEKDGRIYVDVYEAPKDDDSKSEFWARAKYAVGKARRLWLP